MAAIAENRKRCYLKTAGTGITETSVGEFYSDMNNNVTYTHFVPNFIHGVRLEPKMVNQDERVRLAITYGCNAAKLYFEKLKKKW